LARSRADIYVPALLRGIYGNKLLDGENRATWGFGKKRSEEESGAGERAEGRAPRRKEVAAGD